MEGDITEKMKIDIIFPVLNEENRLRNGVQQTVEYLKKSKFSDYKILIVDNGSNDATEEIALELSKENEKIEYIKISEKGVGLAFREGIRKSKFEIVGYMDIDISTDINTLDRVFEIFNEEKNISIVNASRNMKNSIVQGRPLLRIIPSKVLVSLINYLLRINLTDYMCGFKFFKRKKLEELMQKVSNEKGWFYCAELLIYGKWYNYKIKEIPIKWIDERKNSKVDSQILKLTKNYLKNIFRLLKVKKEVENEKDSINRL